MASEPLSDALADVELRDYTPAEQAIAQEEQALAWRLLDSIPDRYRIPIILFYREDQSIKNVASALDLSEKVVRQRLTRGRKLLRDKFADVIGRSLRVTKPNTALTLATMAALSDAVPAKAAAAAVSVAKVTPAATKLLSLNVFSAIASPLISVIATALFHRLAKRAAKSEGEKRLLSQHTLTIGGIVLALAVTMSLISYRPAFIIAHPIVFGVLLLLSIIVSVVLIIVVSLRTKELLREAADTTE